MMKETTANANGRQSIGKMGPEGGAGQPYAKHVEVCIENGWMSNETNAFQVRKKVVQPLGYQKQLMKQRMQSEQRGARLRRDIASRDNQKRPEHEPQYLAAGESGRPPQQRTQPFPGMAHFREPVPQRLARNTRKDPELALEAQHSQPIFSRPRQPSSFQNNKSVSSSHHFQAAMEKSKSSKASTTKY
jgi:hypothetical protein